MQVKFALLFLLLLTRAFIVRHPDANAWSISGQECRLSSNVVSEIFDHWSRTWTIDDTFLNANRLQDVVDCAEEGDTVALKVSKTIRLDRALVVEKNLVIKSVEVNAKASMTCPQKDVLLLVENANVVLENIMIQDCSFQERRELKRIVTLKCDESEDESFTLTLLNADYMKGDKSGESNSIDVEHPECFSVIKKKVEHHKRGLQSTDLSSKVKIQNSVTAIASSPWKAGDSQVTSSSNVLTVESQECSINHYLTQDRTECVECARDQYNFHPNNQTCKSCPDNADCSEEYILPLSGHWNSFPCSKHVQKCLNEDACRGMDPSSLNEIISLDDPATCRLSMEDINKYRDAQCADGYQDLLCGSCKDDYGKIGFLDCIPCRNRYLTIFSLVFTSGLVIYSSWQQISASLELISVRSLRRLERPPSEEREANVQQAFQLLDVPERVTKAQNAKIKFAVVLQIFVDFMQALGAALSLNRDWSVSVNRLLDTSNWVSLNSSQVYTFSFECLLPAHGLVHRSFLSTLFAIFASFLIVGLMLMYWLYETWHENRPWKHFVNRGFLSAISILSVSIYSLTTTVCFFLARVRVFDAILLDNADASHDYWFNDTSIKGPWSNYYIVALLVSILIYIFYGFYNIKFSGLVRVLFQRGTFESEWMKETFGLLAIGYKPQHRWWAFWIHTRKVAIAILFFGGSNIHNLGFGISMTYYFMNNVVMLCYYHPYRTELGHLNFLEGISSFICGLTAMMCIMLSNQMASSSIARSILISIITIGSMLTFIIFGYHLVTNKFIEIKYTLVFEGVVNEDDHAVIVILKYWETTLRNIVKFIGNFLQTLFPNFNR